MKTASSHASLVLSHFDFITVTKNLNTGTIVYHSSDNINFGHSIDLPPNHSELSLICTLRHPYQRVFSLFSRRFLNPNQKPEISEFESFFHERIENDIEFVKTSKMFDNRIPDYVIKSENLYEDYLKIPFIKDSKLNQYGILQDICNRKINKSFGTIDSESYLTQSVKEKIYKMFESHFELFGYQK